MTACDRQRGTEEPLRVLSLGAGVQSSTIALMAAEGEIPMPHCAIFADTQSEPEAVYRYLEYLERLLPFPVHRVSKGSLRQELLDAAAGKRGAWGRPPLHIRNPDGSKGFTRRQCTQDYKIEPIQRKVRELCGVKPRSPGPKHIILHQLIGISTDEAVRMRSSRVRWIRHDYPLVDLGMSRLDCIHWLKKRDRKLPPKSACTFCTFRSDRGWRDMRDNDPDSFRDAVAIDRALREGARHIMLKGAPYLHRSLVPLDEVDLSTAEERGQFSLFGDFKAECEGMCGV